MKVKIFTTGGSIDKYYSTRESSFIVGEPQVKTVLREANLVVDYEVEPLLQKDSLEITGQDRQMIYQKVKDDSHRRILITHGTDTMAATARQLAQIPGKVIVLTGAMQPAAFKYSDAAFNLGCAFLAVQVLAEGVYLVMNGRVFDPQKTVKNLALDRFEEQ
jgi:L-asparaginase